MWAVDFHELRGRVTLERVLELLGFVPVVSRRAGNELRGPCPLPRCGRRPRDRAFAANPRKGVFQCFRCGASGSGRAGSNRRAGGRVSRTPN